MDEDDSDKLNEILYVLLKEVARVTDHDANNMLAVLATSFAGLVSRINNERGPRPTSEAA